MSTALLFALLGAPASASNLEAPTEAKVIRVVPVAAESTPTPPAPRRAATPGRTGCGPRLQAPSGLTVLPLADGERQPDGRLLCSWLVTAHGATELSVGVLGRGHADGDGLRILRADGTELDTIEALTPEQAVLTVPATVVVELNARTLDSFDGVYARVLR
jgi:hypothetical protein